jgi:hypothetical protein
MFIFIPLERRKSQCLSSSSLYARENQVSRPSPPPASAQKSIQSSRCIWKMPSWSCTSSLVCMLWAAMETFCAILRTLGLIRYFSKCVPESPRAFQWGLVTPIIPRVQLRPSKHSLCWGGQGTMFYKWNWVTMRHTVLWEPLLKLISYDSTLSPSCSLRTKCFVHLHSSVSFTGKWD